MLEEERVTPPLMLAVTPVLAHAVPVCAAAVPVSKRDEEDWEVGVAAAAVAL